MNRTAIVDSFQNLLQQWENCFATPIISGELRNWCDHLQQATDEVRMRLRQRMDEAHEQGFSQIMAEDIALASQVEQLKEADQALWEDFENMHKKVTALRDQVIEEGTETDKLHLAAKTVADRGLEMVVRLRKQETALATWLAEALQRDRGVVD